jgi:cell wall-associated NlpC family hydrolase
MSTTRNARAAATAAFVLVAGLPGTLAVAPAAWSAPQAATQPAPQTELPQRAADRVAVPPAPATAVPPAPLSDDVPDATGLPERPTAPRISPLAASVDREAARVEALTERLVEARESLRQLTAADTGRRDLWAAASERYNSMRQRLDGWARESYVRLMETGTAVPGPVAELVNTQAIGTEEAQRLGADFDDAARAVGVTGDAYAFAHRAANRAEGSVRSLEAQHAHRAAALEALRARHRAELERARTTTDRHNAALSRRYLGGFQLAAGGTAAVQRALQFAVAQLGKPYVWGAEGPDTYDCSGLVQAAYAAAGVALPRTARPQYLATVPVPVAAMVPGDLLFFGPDPQRWNSIHHVGIYLGNGKMVHAPTTGDVVRVAPIWWAEFFGATRVVDTAGQGTPGAVTVPITQRPPAPATQPDGAPARRPANPTSPTDPTRPAPNPHPARPAPPGSPPGSPPQAGPAVPPRKGNPSVDPACRLPRVLSLRVTLPVLKPPVTVGIQPRPACGPGPEPQQPCPLPALSAVVGTVRLPASVSCRPKRSR